LGDDAAEGQTKKHSADDEPRAHEDCQNQERAADHRDE
jgi:hypothetical protein